MSIFLASNILCATQSQELSSCGVEGETVHPTADGVLTLNNPVVKEITFPNGDYFRVVSADGEQQAAQAVLRRISHQSYLFVGPENKTCVFGSLLSHDWLEGYCEALAAMLSDANVMKLYLSGVHYPRNIFLENKIALIFLFNARDQLQGEQLPTVFQEFFKDKTEADIMHLSEDAFPEGIEMIFGSAWETLGVLVSCFLNEDNIHTIKNEMFEKYGYLVNIFLNYRELIVNLVNAEDYQLPQKIANHLNLDLKRDGLPRFVLSVDDEVIGFMRFGAYSKAMIDADLKDNPDALALLKKHYLVDKGCAIAAVMIQEQYQDKGYVQAFGQEMFGKILPWYATCPDAPNYPEGQLGQVYITHRIEQHVTVHLLSKLTADSRFILVTLGKFMSGEQRKMAYLLQFAAVEKTALDTIE